jgi:hypothetical protein
MSLTASYVFSFDDYLMLLRGVRSRSRWARWAVLGGAPVLLAMVLIKIVYEVSQEGHIPGWIDLSEALAFVFLMLVAVELGRYLPRIQRMHFRRCALAGKSVTYKLTDEGVSWSRDDISGLYSWSSVTAAVVEPRAIVLVIGKYEGIALPPRAFQTQEEFDAAARFVQKWVKT